MQQLESPIADFDNFVNYKNSSMSGATKREDDDHSSDSDDEVEFLCVIQTKTATTTTKSTEEVEFLGVAKPSPPKTPSTSQPTKAPAPTKKTAKAVKKHMPSKVKYNTKKAPPVNDITIQSIDIQAVAEAHRHPDGSYPSPEEWKNNEELSTREKTVMLKALEDDVKLQNNMDWEGQQLEADSDAGLASDQIL